MDPNVWEKSNRTSFFYRFGLNEIFALSISMIGLYAVAPFGKHLMADIHFMLVFLTTLVISVVAYYVTKVFINQMKSQLCDKGELFGKDLNKVGDQATKEKV